jgi:glutathione S-transferase
MVRHRRYNAAMKLYDNAFSPFARKVRMALEHKGLRAEIVDGLRKDNRELLAAVNGRVEVPTLVDGDVTVINSSDIVGYLDHRYPEKPLLPADPKLRVKARSWERCSDTLVDAILIDISYWSWTRRPDSMPEGMLDAAQRDMERVYDALERDLGHGGDVVCGALSIADVALFPQLSAGKLLGVPFSKERHPHVAAWLRRMSTSPIGAADLARTRAFLASPDRSHLELDKIFWRGDRIEWVLARGFHRWFVGEIEADRVLWPGLAIPPA